MQMVFVAQKTLVNVLDHGLDLLAIVTLHMLVLEESLISLHLFNIHTFSIQRRPFLSSNHHQDSFQPCMTSLILHSVYQINHANKNGEFNCSSLMHVHSLEITFLHSSSVVIHPSQILQIAHWIQRIPMSRLKSLQIPKTFVQRLVLTLV